MKNFDEIVERDGKILGIKEIAIYDENMLVIGFEKQISEQDDNGIFQKVLSERTLFDKPNKVLTYTGTLFNAMNVVKTFLENYEGDYLIEILSCVYTWNGTSFDMVLTYQEIRK